MHFWQRDDWEMQEKLRESHDKQANLADALYRSLGHAVSHWSSLEEALCSIYILAACPHHQTSKSPAGAGFWAVTYESKLKLADAAVVIWARDHEALNCEWNNLIDELMNIGAKRRDLVHGTVITHWHDDTGETFFAPSHFRTSYPPDLNDATIGNTEPVPPEARLSQKEIEQHTAEFSEIAKRLRSFRTVLYFCLQERGAVGLPAGEVAPLPRTETIPYDGVSPPPPEPLQE
jgi:hypothetical protein